MPVSNDLIDARSLEILAENADRADRDAAWPERSWRTLTEAGVQAWSVPRAFGGRDLGLVDLLRGYETLASACLTTAFILSQHEAAVRRVVALGRPETQQRLLPDVAKGRRHLTVGLSQLTTSRQHGPPSLTATLLDAARYRFDGVIPWVTAADRADEILIGATLPDGRQLLAFMSPQTPGVAVESPLELTALAGSRTAQVRCGGATTEPGQILTGPAEQVLAAGKGGVGGLETSCLALGLASAAIGWLARESSARPELAESAARSVRAERDLRERLHHCAEIEAAASDVLELRVECTLLALRATQVALTAAKGTGFVAPHPVQRWARQALFFLVWSCPRPTAEGILARLLD